MSKFILNFFFSHRSPILIWQNRYTRAILSAMPISVGILSLAIMAPTIMVRFSTVRYSIHLNISNSFDRVPNVAFDSNSESNPDPDPDSNFDPNFDTITNCDAHTLKPIAINP